MPHGYEYSFEGEKAERAADYIRSLTLKTEFDENPDVFTGMTWVVELSYEDGKTVTVYMFGNMFIRRADGEWLKMDYDEAEQFLSLLERLK